VASDATSTGPPSPRLQRRIRTRNAVALYVSSVLGPGVLVLPGLAAQVAGPASLLAWGLLGVASIAFALTFASLSSRRPESGGIYGFAREAFGRPAAAITGWLFIAWAWVGAPSVALIAASYLTYAFALPRAIGFLIGFGVIALAFVVNLRGIVLSSRVQLAVIAAIVAFLLIVLSVASVHFEPSHFQPFLPKGWTSVGTAGALIFWAYLGYENVSNVAEEFERPERDFGRAVWISVAVIGALYFAVAFVTVGTGAYLVGAGTAPFGRILADSFGGWGAIGAALFSLVIVFAVVNAYVTGLSRVFYAVAQDGGLPSTLARVHPRTLVPDRAMALLIGGAGVALLVFYFEHVTLSTSILAAGGAALCVYVIGSAAGLRIRLREGRPGRGLAVLAAISLVFSAALIPFVGAPLVVSGGVVGAGALYLLLARSRRPRGKPADLPVPPK